MVETRAPTGNDQAALWGGGGAAGWVVLQDLLDRLFQPFEELLVRTVEAVRAMHVLDVGCGTGGTTLAIARHLAGAGSCTGVDISEPMIGAARARAARAGNSVAVDFIVADAQTHLFPPARFDAIVSRFGVMFFDDVVAAFTNLRRAAKAGAALRAVVWRSAGENPFMTAAERAAAPLLPNLPARRPNEPGQFGFADRAHVHELLERAGWSDVDLQPIDVSCAMSEDALEPYLTHLGPVGRALQQADDALRARVIAAVRPAFDDYVRRGEVRFTAACWMVNASA